MYRQDLSMVYDPIALKVKHTDLVRWLHEEEHNLLWQYLPVLELMVLVAVDHHCVDLPPTIQCHC